MIEICPSVLTNSIEDFTNFVKEYEVFTGVDIDIIRMPFLENETVQLAEVLPILKVSKIKSLGFHLMVADPEVEINQLKETGFETKKLRIYFQQESDIKFLKTVTWQGDWRKCVCLKLDTNLRNIEFYNDFDEVQFMSIEIGGQGREFDESVGEKIEELRGMGYNGIVSLDGGINLRTANIIKNWDIQRVSPGSYFAEADDVELAKMKLDLALNLKE